MFMKKGLCCLFGKSVFCVPESPGIGNTFFVLVTRRRLSILYGEEVLGPICLIIVFRK